MAKNNMQLKCVVEWFIQFNATARIPLRMINSAIKMKWN